MKGSLGQCEACRSVSGCAGVTPSVLRVSLQCDRWSQPAPSQAIQAQGIPPSHPHKVTGIQASTLGSWHNHPHPLPLMGSTVATRFPQLLLTSQL